MAFVQAKCENCGGILTVDDNLKAANCPHCGMAYVVQDAINHFNNITHVEYMHADVVNMVDEKSSVARLEAAEAYMRLNNYAMAEQEYAYVTKIAPQNYKGWWGTIRSKTFDFRKRIRSKAELDKLKGLFAAVEEFVPADVHEEVRRRWTLYYGSQERLNNTEISEVNGNKQKIKQSLLQIEQKISGYKYEIDELKKRVEQNHFKINELRKEKPLKKPSWTGSMMVVMYGLLLIGILAIIFADGWIKGIAAGGVALSILVIIIKSIITWKYYDKMRTISMLEQDNKRMSDRRMELCKQLIPVHNSKSRARNNMKIEDKKLMPYR